MANKYYAVKKGHQTGIFDTWAECESNTKGFRGSEYKSFGSIEDARKYLEDKPGIENVSPIDVENIPEDKVIAYVDGSFSEAYSKYAFGCVLISRKHAIIKESGCKDDPQALLSRNVAGEILGAIFAVEWALSQNYSSIEIRHDYEGLAKWVSGEWKAKTQVSVDFVEKMISFQDQIHIEFVKVPAHTNNYFNDMADKLAKDALTSNKKPPIVKGTTYFKAEGIRISDVLAVIELIKENVDSAQIKLDKEFPYGRRIDLVAGKDKIFITFFNDKDKVMIQGSHNNLFSLALTYFSELIDFDEIPEIFNNFIELSVDKEGINKEYKALLPNSADKHPEKIRRVLLQAVCNMNINGMVFDATFLVHPVLRALEGHLKLIMKLHNLPLRNPTGGNRDCFFIFDKIGNAYQVNNQYSGNINSSIINYIGRCYTVYNVKRNQFFHWDDASTIIDTTPLVNSPHDARNIINETMRLIDEYYTFQ